MPSCAQNRKKYCAKFEKIVHGCELAYLGTCLRSDVNKGTKKYEQSVNVLHRLILFILVVNHKKWETRKNL